VESLVPFAADKLQQDYRLHSLSEAIHNTRFRESEHIDHAP
jgi:hypothetical protein